MNGLERNIALIISLIQILFNIMKNLKDIILEKLIINKNTKVQQHYNYHPENSNELANLINKLIEERGNNANLNDIDTSEITDMIGVFCDSEFNGDISNWDVSNVEDMFRLFYKSKFNGDISKWDVSNVKTMFKMFEKCPLEKNPPKWYNNN